MAVEAISREKQKELFDMFDTRTPEGKPTIEEIAGVAGVSLGTCSKYFKRWTDKREADARMKAVAIQQSPIDLLESYLRTVPGANTQGVDWCVSQLRLKEESGVPLNPAEILQLVVESTKVKPYFAQEAVKTAFGAQTSPMSPFLGPYGAPQTPPQHWQQQIPGFQAFGPYGAAYAPGGPFPGIPVPPWSYPPGGPYGYPAPQAPLSRDDVKGIVVEAMRSSQPPVTNLAPSTEEVEEPVLGADGQPLTGPDGTVLFRKYRRPVQAQGEAQIVARTVASLKEAGIVGDRGDGLAELRQELQAMRAPTTDPTLTAMLDEMRKSQATILAQLEAEKARREEAEKWSMRLEAKEEELRKSERERAEALAKAGSSLPAADQIALKAVDKLEKVIDNNEKRMDRAERIITPLLTGDGMKSLPLGDAEAANIVARQEAIDAAQTTPATLIPHVLPGGR